MDAIQSEERPGHLSGSLLLVGTRGISKMQPTPLLTLPLMILREEFQNGRTRPSRNGSARVVRLKIVQCHGMLIRCFQIMTSKRCTISYSSCPQSTTRLLLMLQKRMTIVTQVTKKKNGRDAMHGVSTILFF